MAAKKDTRKITASGSSSKVVNKTLKEGSMASNSKIVPVKPAKKASTKYSPAPMSAAAKAKAKTAGATAQGKTGKLSPAQKKMFKELPREGSRNPKAGSSTVSKIVKRAKTTGREARDVITAVGSAAQAVRKSPQENMPVAGAIKNVAKQVKEVGKAAATGKKGTTAYKITPNAASQKNRKERGSKGYVFYDIKHPKNR